MGKKQSKIDTKVDGLDIVESPTQLENDKIIGNADKPVDDEIVGHADQPIHEVWRHEQVILNGLRQIELLDKKIFKLNDEVRMVQSDRILVEVANYLFRKLMAAKGPIIKIVEESTRCKGKPMTVEQQKEVSEIQKHFQQVEYVSQAQLPQDSPHITAMPVARTYYLGDDEFDGMAGGVRIIYNSSMRRLLEGGANPVLKRALEGISVQAALERCSSSTGYIRSTVHVSTIDSSGQKVYDDPHITIDCAEVTGHAYCSGFNYTELPPYWCSDMEISHAKWKDRTPSTQDSYPASPAVEQTSDRAYYTGDEPNP
ncbi:hypothetical protein ACHAPT_009780 [Fusarium lateritium]